MGKQRESQGRAQLAQDLARLALLGGTGDDAAERRAWRIISQCIETQDDATLASGLGQTTEIDAHEFLWQQINFFASTLLLQERRTGTPVLAELFAIPVLLADAAPFTPPARLPGMGDLRRLARRRGLLNNRNDRLFLLPQLFTREELAQLPWSGLYTATAALSRQLLHPAGSGEKHSLPALPLSRATAPATAGNVHLRFIVGSVVFDPDLADMPLLREENGDQYRNWCEDVAGFLRQSPRMQVTLFKPALIPEALVQGQMQVRLHALRAALAEALAVTETEADCLSVYITVHGESDAAIKEFRMAAYAWDDAEEQVFTHVWEMAPHENPNEVAGDLCSLFEAAGVVNLFVLGEVLPDDRCDCCGGPLFRGPMETDDAPETMIHPGSRLLH